MKTALFVNFSSRPFTGTWDGKSKVFAPGSKTYMPDYLAKHYAKHLVNRELTETVKGGEVYTSPKKPEQVPQFFNLFNKAFIPDDESPEQSELEAEIDSANREPSVNIAPTKIEAGVQMIPGDDNDDEEAFDGTNTK